jgi:hypothetical protein
MASCPQWGDRPKAQAHHHVHSIAPPVAIIKTREASEADLSASDNDEDALTIGDMNRIIEPLPPPPKRTISTIEWSLESLVASGKRFHIVPRVSASSKKLPTEIDYYEQSGIPVIIEGWDQHSGWPKKLFHIDGFSAHGPAGEPIITCLTLLC